MGCTGITATAGAAAPVLATPGSSPFNGCTADQAGRSRPAGSVSVSQLRGRAARGHRPNESAQHRRRVPAGSLVRRRRARPRDERQPRRRGSWHRVVVPGITRCSGGTYDRASDPWVSFAPNGDLYAISLSFDAFDTRNAIIVSKSTTKGETWAADRRDRRRDERSRQGVDHGGPVRLPVRLRGLGPLPLAAGRSARVRSGQIHAQSYVQQLWFSRTTDGGATWEPARVAYNPGTMRGRSAA